MEFPYNSKIMSDGKYRYFHGYTSVSMVSNNLDCVEEFLKGSPLSEYFSPLPSDSYHMTIYNIWCHGQRLLPLQKEWLDKEYKRLKKTIGKDNADKYKERFINNVKGSESVCWGWPDSVMFNSMYRTSKICKKHITEKFIVNVDMCISKGTLVLPVQIDNAIIGNKLDLIKKECTDLYKKDDSGMKYHITLGYRYKDIPETVYPILNEELEKLNELISTVCSNRLILNPPDAYWFNSMTTYLTMDEKYF